MREVLHSFVDEVSAQVGQGSTEREPKTHSNCSLDVACSSGGIQSGIALQIRDKCSDGGRNVFQTPDTPDHTGAPTRLDVFEKINKLKVA